MRDDLPAFTFDQTDLERGRGADRADGVAGAFPCIREKRSGGLRFGRRVPAKILLVPSVFDFVRNRAFCCARETIKKPHK
jgi:hypothetical protein